MRRNTGNNFFYVVLLLATVLLSAPIHLIAQDSVPQGTIKVRRAPVQSDYFVKLDYAYHPKRSMLSHYIGRKKADDAVYSPPEPAVFDQRENDSSQTLLDSSFMITFYNRMGNPEQEFPWIEMLNQYEHTFAWDDTTGTDSAVFVFEVNARGQVKLRQEPVAPNDTSAARLQKNLLPYMKKLWIWYPAAQVTDDNRRQKKAACTVRVKVYAVKEGCDSPVF